MVCSKPIPAMKTKPKEIEYYLSLPHTTILQRDEDGYVIARIDGLHFAWQGRKRGA
jgi:hypothetical protein